MATRDLKQMTLNSDEIELVNIWNNIIAEAKTTLNYDHTLSYGVYQITMQLNTFHKESNGVSEKAFMIILF